MILILSCLYLTGCSRYFSRYKAVGFVHSNSSRSAFMNFFEFEGTMAFRLKNKNSNGGQISYSASLETGDATVYFDCSGTKTELFSIHSGEDVDSSLMLPEAGTVYILVQSDGKCQNGSFRFEIE